MATDARGAITVGAGLLIAGLTIIGLGTTAPARADTESYLNELRDAGITNPRGDIGMEEWGWEVCELFAKGFPPDKVLKQAVYNSSSRPPFGMTVQQANAVVDFAVADLCTARK